MFKRTPSELEKLHAGYDSELTMKRVASLNPVTEAAPTVMSLSTERYRALSARMYDERDSGGRSPRGDPALSPSLGSRDGNCRDDFLIRADPRFTLSSARKHLIA